MEKSEKRRYPFFQIQSMATFLLLTWISLHEIMFELALKLNTSIDELYEAWGWDLYDVCGLEHAYDALRVAMQ